MRYVETFEDYSSVDVKARKYTRKKVALNERNLEPETFCA
jgi:hypothetical protein